MKTKDLRRKSDRLLVKGIYPISTFAINRITQEYPFFRGIERFYLGVSDHGNNAVLDEDTFHVVSCSELIPRKRVQLIVGILMLLKFEVRWIHFGDGELRSETEALASELPPNIQWEIRGLVPNSSVIEHYRTRQVDMVINVSTLEGVPVALMEAISFGIPVMGCDSCGVPEIVTEDTGFLIPLDFAASEVAALISDYHLNYPDKKGFRSGVKSFWAANYNAAVNYPEFIERCLQARNPDQSGA